MQRIDTIIDDLTRKRRKNERQSFQKKKKSNFYSETPLKRLRRRQINVQTTEITRKKSKKKP